MEELIGQKIIEARAAVQAAQRNVGWAGDNLARAAGGLQAQQEIYDSTRQTMHRHSEELARAEGVLRALEGLEVSLRVRAHKAQP